MRKHLDVRQNVRPAPHVAAVAAAAALILALLAAAPSVLSPTPPGTVPGTAQSTAQPPRSADGGVRLRVPAVVGQTTLVGHHYDTPPPWPHGNCFSLSRLSLQQRRALERSPGPSPYPYELQVLNMHAANFGHIVRELRIDTIEIERVGKQHCLIVDARIPQEWLLEVPCRACAPDFLRKDLGSPHRAASFRKASL